MPTLEQERADLYSEIRRLATSGDPNKWSPEVVAKWDQLNKRYDTVADRLQNSGGGDWSGLIGRDNGALDDRDNGRSTAPRNDSGVGAALGAWLKFGVASAQLSDAEQRAADRMGVARLAQNELIVRPFNVGLIPAGGFRNALGTQVGTQGGALVGESFSDAIELAMFDIGGILTTSETFVTSTGDDFTWPTGDDTSEEGEQVGENTDLDTDTSEPFAAQKWHAYKFSSKILKVAYELIEDSRLPLDRIVARILGERLGKILSRRFTTGNAAAQPNGIVNAATTGATTASATAITFDEVLDLIYSVNQARRVGASFMFNDEITKVLRKLKSGAGEYLWSPVTVGQPDMIWGFPHVTNPYMASTVEADAVTMLFGQLNQYKVRRVNQLRFRRLNERYADTDQIGFIALIRADGNLLDSGDHPVKKLVQHA